jgi:hypothetical protein
MPQFVPPVSDVSTGGWGSTPLYEKLDEAVASDADFVEVTDPDQDPFEVKLGSLVPPPWEFGTPRLSVRLRRTTPRRVRVKIELLAGAEVLAVGKLYPSLQFQTVSLPLTAAKVALITDFADMRARITASCLPDDSTYNCFNFPSTLYGRWTNKGGDAAGLPDTFEFHKVSGCSSSMCYYYGETGSMAMGTCNSQDMYIMIACQGDDWSISTAASGGLVNGFVGWTPVDSVVVSPLLITVDCEFSPIGGQAALGDSTCEGSATLQVKETPF